jgi:hypothetical protein
MFEGVITQQMRAYLVEMVDQWGVKKLYNGCAGNFTVARSLPGIEHYGNDVTIYSSAIGWWASGQPVPITLKPESEEELGWLQGSLSDPASCVATILLGTDFLDSVGRRHRFHERKVKAYRTQWAKLHEKTRAKLTSPALSLAGYACQDVLDWISKIPKSAPFVSFPPFYGGGYELMWAPLERHFDWPAPSYTVMGEKEKDQLIERVMDRKHWFLGLRERPEHLRDYLRGEVQTTAHGLPVYLYASSGPTRVVVPKETLAPVLTPRLGPQDELSGDERVGLLELTADQLSWLRVQYLDPRIKTANPASAYAVTLDGKIAGCLAFKSHDGRFGGPWAYMLSDFPVAPTVYKRLAALIVMCAQSEEVRLLLCRSLSRDIRYLATTAFTDNQVSMKYRTGGLRIGERRPGKDGHKYAISYTGETGRRPIQNVYADWYAKHGGVR